MMKYLLLLAFLPIKAYALQVSMPYIFSPGQKIVASQMNANFNTLSNVINGNIASDNIVEFGIASQNIAESAITNSKLSSSDLQSLGSATASNAIYWRRAPGDWQPVGYSGSVSFNTGTITATAGGSLIGTITYPGTASCRWEVTSSSFGNFAADTDCASPTVTGNVTAPATKIPAAVINVSSTSDYYQFIAIGRFEPVDQQVGYFCSYRFSDGTTPSSAQKVGSSNTTATSADRLSFNIMEGVIKFASTGSKTVNLQSLSSNNTNICSVTDSTATVEDFQIQVYRFPIGSP